MIQTLQLDRILHGAVATRYRDLVTRPTGVAIRNSLERAMAEARCVTALLDFSAVGLLDFSCADEVVAKLLLNPPSGERPHVILVGLSEAQTEAIDHVLSHHRLVAVVLPGLDQPPVLLGAPAPELRAAFDLVQQTGGCTGAELARDLGWPPGQAQAVLAQLARHRVVRVERDQYRPIPLQ